MATRRSARLTAQAAATAPSSSSSSLPVILVPEAPRGKSAAAPPRGRKRKAQEAEITAPAPVTPPRKLASRSAALKQPAPAPEAVSLIAENASGVPPATPKPKPLAVSRLAATDPNATHATLISPETSRVIKLGGTAAAAAATDDILNQACRHLISVDRRMKPLIEQHRCQVFSDEGLAEKIDPFESLTSGVIAQQVSGAAAKSIKARFVGLFSDGESTGSAESTESTESTEAAKFPSPSVVAACSLERLRSAGLSQRKAEYIQGLAAKFTSGELSASMLVEAPYEEVIEKLTAVRGLGRWSVEMFACFALKRLDVFSLGDLGVQRGMAAFVGRDIGKLKAKGGKWKYMSEKEMEEISARFAPYRSLFMWYMWRVEQTDISVLQ